MKIKITKEAKQWLTVAEMPEVRKMISDLKDEDIMEDVKMAVRLLTEYSGIKIFEPSAEIAWNDSINDYYTDHSGHLDVWITFSVLDKFNWFVEGGLYLSDIWQIGDLEVNEALRKKMYCNTYKFIG